MIDSTLKNDILKWFSKMDSYDKRKAIADARNNNELTDLVSDINTILRRYNITKTITEEQIVFDSELIHNIFLKDKSLSNIIFDHCFPKPTEKIFSHYTTFATFANIVSSRTLRLYNLHKNYAAGEFSEFYEDHGIVGYNDKTKTLGIPTDKDTIMSQIFCLCLTGFGHDRFETNKWRDFGNFGKGIRIDFEIEPHIAEFRKIYYPKPAKSGIPILKDLFSEIPSKYTLPLNFTGISKIGSYYIKNEFSSENEYRFLIKRTSDEYLAHHLQPINENESVAFINIALNSPFADFKVISVQPGYDFPNEHLDEIENLIKTHSPLTTLQEKAIDFSQF
jgi:hypothetical protein